MTKSSRLAFLGVLSLAAFGSGCVVEEPYPAWTTPQDLPSPLRVQSVIEFVKEGLSEDAIPSRVQWDGLAARPSAAEIQALREAGANDRFMAGLLAAPIPYFHELPPGTAGDVQLYFWPPILWPYCGWAWQAGRMITYPGPAKIEP